MNFDGIVNLVIHLHIEEIVMFGFGKSAEREKIERDVRTAREAGVDIRVVGRGTLLVDSKNLDKVDHFRKKAQAVRELISKGPA